MPGHPPDRIPSVTNDLGAHDERAGIRTKQSGQPGSVIRRAGAHAAKRENREDRDQKRRCRDESAGDELEVDCTHYQLIIGKTYG
jgi:hypothetical protein